MVDDAKRTGKTVLIGMSQSIEAHRIRSIAHRRPLLFERPLSDIEIFSLTSLIVIPTMRPTLSNIPESVP